MRPNRSTDASTLDTSRSTRGRNAISSSAIRFRRMVGSVSAAWRNALRAPLAAYVGDQLVVDLRSGAYGSLWAAGANAVSVRVLHERESGGVVRRSVVSHFNKATKGRLTRALLESGQRPGKPDEFTDVVRALGFTVEPGPPGRRPDAPVALDIVVREL